MKNIFRQNSTNIFTCFLSKLEIKYTTNYADKLFNEHPYRNSMYGLSQLLSQYNIPNGGIKIDDKDITRLTPPFIAHLGNRFVVVEDIADNEISYIWDGRRLKTGIVEIIQQWTGIVLLAEPDENSQEPDYKKHMKEEVLISVHKGIIYTLFILGILLAGYYNGIWKSGSLTVSFLISFTGMLVCFLLIGKQMKIKNSYADKICSLLHQKDCNKILESDAAKLFKKYSWGEIGLGYFTSNIILILFYPPYINYYAIINAVCLPYTLWSIWYQYRIAKQWCNLCLIVQGLLWIICGINLISGYFIKPSFFQ